MANIWFTALHPEATLIHSPVSAFSNEDLRLSSLQQHGREAIVRHLTEKWERTNAREVQVREVLKFEVLAIDFEWSEDDECYAFPYVHVTRQDGGKKVRKTVKSLLRRAIKASGFHRKGEAEHCSDSDCEGDTQVPISNTPFEVDKSSQVPQVMPRFRFKAGTAMIMDLSIFASSPATTALGLAEMFAKPGEIRALMASLIVDDADPDGARMELRQILQ